MLVELDPEDMVRVTLDTGSRELESGWLSDANASDGLGMRGRLLDMRGVLPVSDVRLIICGRTQR
jgi:hypothetical protein